MAGALFSCSDSISTDFNIDKFPSTIYTEGSLSFLLSKEGGIEMYQNNRWLQCLNCGEEYSIDDLFHINNQANCPGCNSNESIELSLSHSTISNNYMSLNESLMKDGEWN